MVVFKYVVKDYDDAVAYSRRLTLDKVKNSVFKPVLLYLREINGDNVYDPDFGLRDSIKDIQQNSNMYFQLTRENSRNVRYFENGMICEPDSEYPDSTLVFLLNGTLYLIDSSYEKSVDKAKELLGNSLRITNDASFISRAKNIIVEERKKALVNNLIDHLEVALGIDETNDKYRYQAKAVDLDLEAYTDKMADTKGNSR